MIKKYNGLCIGGPWAGRMVNSDKPYHKVADYPRLSVGDFLRMNTEELLTRPTEYQVTLYKHETMRTPQGDIHYWAPEDFTPLDVLNTLLETYEVSVNNRHSLGHSER